MHTSNDTATVLNLIILAEKRGKNNLFASCVAGRKGLENRVTNAINRPGLALNRVFTSFGEDRIQLFGIGEIAFLHQLKEQRTLIPTLEAFFEHSIACCIVSHIHKNVPPKAFIDFCEKKNCPLLYSSLTTHEVSVRLSRLLTSCFAPRTLRHGVFMEIRDLGVLISGESGVGKSETALGLLDRGSSRIISDDVVLLEKMDETSIVGRVPSISHRKHYVEIRGVGFINLSQVYGVNMLLKEKPLSLEIHLKIWEEQDESEMERLEMERFTEILGVDIPFVQIPVKVGRNIPLIVETAVIKHQLKLMGYHGKEDPFLW